MDYISKSEFEVVISSKLASTQNEKNSQIKIASAHIHIPRNNPAKFRKYLMDGLGGVADKGPLYMYIKEIVLGGNSHKIPPPMEKSQIYIQCS